MPRIKIETTQNVILQTELASLGDRVVAAIIDYVILSLYTAACIYIMFDIWGREIDSNGNIRLLDKQIAFLFVTQLPSVFYFPLFEFFQNGKSLGKMVLNIQIVPLDGGRLNIGQVFVRNTFRLIDVWGIRLFLWAFTVGGGFNYFNTLPIPIIGILFIAFTKKEQRIGDMSAGTVVVKLRKRASLKDTVFHNVEENYKPVYTNVLMLSDYDVRAIKEAIMLAERYNNYKYAKELAIQVKKHLKISEKVPATSFLKTILKDYNYLANQAA